MVTGGALVDVWSATADDGRRPSKCPYGDPGDRDPPGLQSDHRVRAFLVKLGGKDLAHPAHKGGDRDQIGNIEKASGKDTIGRAQLVAQLLGDPLDLLPGRHGRVPGRLLRPP